mmetsp:Transcript_103401/g.287947  ORF Transcript_103401/g.287947 Transcript_103401/m.287947 type:complete len:227 (-) Transcript_103401:41-721(-)
MMRRSASRPECGPTAASGARTGASRRGSSSATRRKAVPGGCAGAGVSLTIKEAGMESALWGSAATGTIAAAAVTVTNAAENQRATRPLSAGVVHGAWEAPAPAPAVRPEAAWALAASSGSGCNGRRDLLLDLVGPDGVAEASSHCTISTDGDASAGVRTKVFRMGAPLLRSTIPLSLGEHYHREGFHGCSKPVMEGGSEGEEETVLSVSDGEDDFSALSVTLDFPC